MAVEAVDAGLAAPGSPVRLVTLFVALTPVVLHVLEPTMLSQSKTSP